jgi:phosphopantothenoylcysteine decarboxylase / phosphopantothenate---cysteine ligase
MSLINKKILIHVTGSISAFKACTLVSSLKKEGAQVRVSLSSDGERFVGGTSFEGLTGEPLLNSLWTGQPDPVPHITLAQNWADLLLVYPASAHTINRLASGLSDDLFGAVFLANNFRKPVWIAPAMNSEMFAHPALRESQEKLTRWGCRILPTGEGRMACGSVGKGRLWEPEKVLEALKEHFTLRENNTLEGKTLIITSGGCEEPLDGVRYLSNFSTGKTGVILAEEALARGAKVMLLASRRGAVPLPQEKLTIDRYTSYSDLETLLFKALKKSPQGVIMAAAVSDFSVKKIQVKEKELHPGQDKLSSQEAPIIHLKKNKKLIGEVKRCYPPLLTVAFKLTNTTNKIEREKAVDRLFSTSGTDYILANDLTEITDNRHMFKLISPRGVISQGETKKSLAQAILKIWERED